MRPEYDFSKGLRGKYATRFEARSKVVVLDPDLAEVFPDSKAVNDALRALATAARKAVSAPRSHARPQRARDERA